jgi:hypothetical protein
MERELNNLLDTYKYTPPYDNHNGGGTALGAGNIRGCGRCATKIEYKEDYNGKDIISYNGNKTYFINDYLLFVKHFRFPWFKAEIIKNDFTTQPCYFANLNGKFVISDSIKSVYEELKNKINRVKYNESDMARAFVICHPDCNKKYKWGEMLEWHTLSLNSCANGRKLFSDVCHKKNNDMVTPKEFIELIKKYSPAVSLGIELEKIYNC